MRQILLSKISRQIGYPLFWKYRGLEVKNKLAKLQKSEWLSRDEILAIQWRRLTKLLKHAYENVPYYRKLFLDLRIMPEDIKDYNTFRKMPFLSKADIRSNFESLVATNMDQKLMRLDWTGGSTGENITFLEDRTELGYRFANTIRGDSIAGLCPGTRFVELWGALLDAPRMGSIGSLLSRLAFRRMFLSVYNLSESEMKLYVQSINKFKPEVILAYPSPLYHFAKFILIRNLKLEPIKSIITSAETLTCEQRETIESVFKCRVYNRYGCREFGNLASECEKHNGLHVFSDMYFIEVLRDGNPVDHGKMGEIIVTDLHKYGMPLIRYRIGDIGVSSDQNCTCGRGLPVLKEIQGRIFDVVSGINGQYVAGNYFSFLSRQVIGIRKFQVIQEKLNEISVSIVPDDSFKTESLAFIEEQIHKNCGAGTRVSFQIVDFIPLTKSGKHRFIISKVPVNFN